MRATCVVSLVASVLVSVLALAFFFACRQHAVAEGLELRNVVYLVPTACVLVTCLVVVPIVAVASSLGPSRDYRVAGCAVACALALMPAMLFTSFRLELPEGSARSDGSIEVVTRPWFGVPTVQRACGSCPTNPRLRLGLLRPEKLGWSAPASPPERSSPSTPRRARSSWR